MSNLFMNIMKQALITFDQSNVTSIKTNFGLLTGLIDQLTISELGLNPDLFSEDTFNKPNKAPCSFVHIFQNNKLSMSVFVLRGGYTMPLHDHPVMHGILKALTGKLLVQSFTKINDSNESEIYDRNCHQFKVTAEIPLCIDNNCESAILTPKERNFHEITAVDNVAAFFDILGPPYDVDIPKYGIRQCSFYKKHLNENLYTLEKIPTPLSYYCDTGFYNKPKFLREYVDLYETEEN